MKSKRIIGLIIKFAIVAFALFFLYDQLTAKTSIVSGSNNVTVGGP